MTEVNTDRPAPPEAATSERVWTVAAQLFREKGYHATTTREIADRLQITRATLYYHVDKKEDLLYGICTESLARVSNAVSKAIEAVDDQAERVPTLIQAHLVTMVRDIDMHATMLLELRHLNGHQLDAVVELRDGYESLVASVVSDAQKAGALRSDVPTKYATLALLNLLNWTISWYRPDGPLKPAAFAKTLSDIYLQGMTAP